MPTFAGGNIAMGNAQKANVAVSLLIQPLHKDMNRALVVVTDGGKTLRISCQQHQRGFPGGDQLFCDAGKAKQHHAINVTSSEHAQMFHYQRRRELTFHHNRVVALFVKRRQHGLNREVFRQRIKASDDNSDHFIALSPHRAGGAGRGETVLIHHRFDTLAGTFAYAAFIVKHAGNG